MPGHAAHSLHGGAAHFAVDVFVDYLRFFGLLTGAPGAAASRISEDAAAMCHGGMALAAVAVAVQWENLYCVAARASVGRPPAREQPVACEHVPTALLIACRAVCRRLQSCGLAADAAEADQEPVRLIYSLMAFNEAEGLSVAIAELALRAVWQDAHPTVRAASFVSVADVASMRRCVDAAMAPTGTGTGARPSAVCIPADLAVVTKYPDMHLVSEAGTTATAAAVAGEATGQHVEEAAVPEASPPSRRRSLRLAMRSTRGR